MGLEQVFPTLVGVVRSWQFYNRPVEKSLPHASGGGPWNHSSDTKKLGGLPHASGGGPADDGLLTQVKNKSSPR